MAKSGRRHGKRKSSLAGKCKVYHSGSISRKVCWGKDGRIKSNKVSCRRR